MADNPSATTEPNTAATAPVGAEGYVSPTMQGVIDAEHKAAKLAEEAKDYVVHGAEHVIDEIEREKHKASAHAEDLSDEDRANIAMVGGSVRTPSADPSATIDSAGTMIGAVKLDEADFPYPDTTTVVTKAADVDSDAPPSVTPAVGEPVAEARAVHAAAPEDEQAHYGDTADQVVAKVQARIPDGLDGPRAETF